MRPKLGDHVRARWHRIGDQSRVVLHTDDAISMVGEREWRVLRSADGTRDVEGLSIASGLPIRAVAELVASAGELGLFDDSPAQETPSFARDLPIRALARYRFRCTGAGTCCRSFGSILFTELDLARARAARPAFDPPFLPEHGGSSPLSCVAFRDGACSYLEEDGRCSIHTQKPIGCRIFPVRFVDVGHEIRVLPRLECACAFEPGDEPLTEAARGADLPREIFVPQLPLHIEIAGERWPRAQAVAFSDALEVPDEGDLVALVWSLACDLAGDRDLDRELARVQASADRLVARSAWRSANDYVRQSALAAQRAIGAPPSAGDRADEALYLRSAFFAVLGAERSIDADLRHLALTMRIARSLEAPHPIAIVEMLARGHGLAV